MTLGIANDWMKLYSIMVFTNKMFKLYFIENFKIKDDKNAL